MLPRQPAADNALFIILQRRWWRRRRRRRKCVWSPESQIDLRSFCDDEEQKEGSSRWNWLLDKITIWWEIDLSDYVEGRAHSATAEREAATYQTCPSEKDKSKKVKSKRTFVQWEQTFSSSRTCSAHLEHEQSKGRTFKNRCFLLLLWLKWDSAGAGSLKSADVRPLLCSCCLSTWLKVEFSLHLM